MFLVILLVFFWVVCVWVICVFRVRMCCVLLVGLVMLVSCSIWVM